MSSRLRKLYLVNCKTSGGKSSGRISEIDPRGGAAITGANGAGKTTTLQVLPLFFGYSPGQMSQQGENREAMLRFILPHPESAVVFEYQRGDELQDVCHIILRRESNADVGEYRFVQGPINFELLVAKHGADQSIFLDDEGTRDAAMRLGLGDGFSAKLKLAAYRSVILNVPGTGKDDIHRRQLAQRFSFSHQRLTNLDRLVAAIVKEHLNFTDFSDVVAQIVMDQLGVSAHRSAGNKALQLRQSKQQIEQWLRDRDAVERALKLDSEVQKLREVTSQFRSLEMALGGKRADCLKLTSLNEAEATEASNAKDALNERREQAEEHFKERKTVLEHNIRLAEEDEKGKSNRHRTLRNRRDYLEESDAQGWAQKTLELSGLEGHEQSLDSLVKTLSNVAAGVENDYAEKLRAVDQETSLRVGEMRKEFEQITKLVNGEISTLEDQERSNLEELEPMWSGQTDEAAQQVETCIRDEVQAQGQLQRPRIDEALETRLQEAREANGVRLNAVIDAGRDVSRAREAFNTAEKQWRQAQEVHKSQREQLFNAQSNLAAIREKLQPPAGTLHAALLNSGDEEWKNSLAKVISEDLLLRDDLQPHKVADEALLYGWGLNLENIERPGWVDQEALHQQLEEASRAVEVATGRLEEARLAFAEAEDARSQAQDAKNQAEANEGILQKKSSESVAQLKSIEEAAASALKRVKEDAKRAVDIAKQALQEAKATQLAVKGRIERERAEKREEFSQQRQQARARGERKKAEVGGRIEAFEKHQEEVKKAIIQTRDQELNAKGVDTEKLSKFRKELQELRAEIRTIQEKAPIVREWQDWLREQGPINLVDAKVALDRAKEHVEQRQLEMKAADETYRTEKAKFSSEEIEIDRRISKVNGELSILRGLAAELADFAKYGLSAMTINDLAGALKADVHLLLDDYAKKRQAMRTKLEQLERSLTEGESSTKDFVLGVLREVANDAKDQDRAAALARVYDRIRTDVLLNVNTSLKTMLENIASYRQTIWDFESEVRKFNSKLQTGLSLVSRRFSRFSDFKVSVVTDFDKIDFIGKLKVLDAAIRDHRDRNVATYTIEPPPATTAHALRAFMTALDKGSLELNLGDHITLSGSVVDDGVFKQFHSDKELEKISSNGLTAIALISLLSGLMNVIRGQNEIYVPWPTDEIGRFDGSNFQRLMEMMAENRIDPITASPALTPASYSYFKHRYVFKPGGVIAEYRPRAGHGNALGEVAA